MFERGHKKWNTDEEEFIRTNYKRLSVNALAEKLGRSAKATRSHIERMGIRLSDYNKTRAKWTTEEERILRENINSSIDELSEIIPRHTKHAIKAKRHKLGFVRRWNPKRLQNGYKVRFKNGKSYPEHRIIVAEHIGRKLGKSEVIHHVNLNR